MPTLLLVRHGRSTANTGGILAGRRAGVHLDDSGREQAAAAGGRLSPVDIAAVVSSPLERCLETAALAFPSCETTIDARLIECDYGQWTDQELKQLVNEPLWADIQQAPSTVTFPGGEAMAAMSRRVTTAIREWDEEVRAAHGDWAVWAIVSHADPIKAAVAAAIGLPLDRFQNLVVNPGSVTVLHFPRSADETGTGAQRAVLLALNSISGSLDSLIPTAPPVEPGGGAGAVPPAYGSETPKV